MTVAEHDEALEVGLAAGLDLSTALAISEADESPRRPAEEKTGNRVVVVAGAVAIGGKTSPHSTA
jgi:hypothetical protein